MTQFQTMVLDYLEHYQPDRYHRLRRERELRSYVDTLVEQLYAETERVLRLLRERFPSRPEDYLTVYAEELAIASVLPLPQEPAAGDQGEPASQLQAISSIRRLGEISTYRTTGGVSSV